jgi:hypothetical protein
MRSTLTNKCLTSRLIGLYRSSERDSGCRVVGALPTTGSQPWPSNAFRHRGEHSQTRRTSGASACEFGVLFERRGCQSDLRFGSNCVSGEARGQRLVGHATTRWFPNFPWRSSALRVAYSGRGQSKRHEYQEVSLHELRSCERVPRVMLCCLIKCLNVSWPCVFIRHLLTRFFSILFLCVE